MSGEGTELTTNTKKYVSYFSCIMTLEGKIFFNPWSIEKSITQKLGTTLKTIRSQSETKFVIEVDSEKGSVIMPKIKKTTLCRSKKNGNRRLQKRQQVKGTNLSIWSKLHRLQNLTGTNKTKKLSHIEEATWI